MLELVLIYCMIGQPDRCVERREPVDGIEDGLQCVMRGQTEAVRFLATHPKWRLATWRCLPSSMLQDPA